MVHFSKSCRFVIGWHICRSCLDVFPPQVLTLRDVEKGEDNPELFTLHSPSISSLLESKNMHCHLCVMLWEAATARFQELLQVEKETGVIWEVRYYWDEDKRANKYWTPGKARFLVFVILEKPQPGKHAGQSTRVGIFWLTLDSDFSVNGDPPVYNTTQISASTSSNETNSICNSWISDCNANHEKCHQWQQSRGRWNPTRVLDVGIGGESSEIKLFHPNPEHSESIRYTTLSHRWGQSKVLTLLSSNIDQLKERIQLDDLTKTFRDAIAITRKMNVRYLWIDSLCIMQDSVKDWQFESARMGEVYKYGYCNIAATGATDELEGCYFDRDPIIIQPLMMDAIFDWQERVRGPKRYCLTRQFDEWEDIAAASLNKRAWVLQERFMSPRTLYYSSTQVFWECCRNWASETWPGGRPKSLVYGAKADYVRLGVDPLWSVTSKNPDWLVFPASISYWRSTVELYSDTQLTKETDRLIAISGIAKTVQETTNLEYLAGLWNFELVYQLGWRPVKAKAGIRCTTSYIAPSWSWASVSGRVEHVLEDWYRGTQWVVTISATTTPIADPLGQVSAGSIQLRGLLATDMVGLCKHDVKTPACNERSCSADIIDSNRAFVVGCWFDTAEDIDFASVYCLPLRGKPMTALYAKEKMSRLLGKEDLEGLLLLPTGSTPGEFRRCGTFSCMYEGGQPFREALKNFAAAAETSGLPYEAGSDGNKFLITLI